MSSQGTPPQIESVRLAPFKTGPVDRLTRAIGWSKANAGNISAICQTGNPQVLAKGVRTDLIPHRNLLTFEVITQTGVLQG